MQRKLGDAQLSDAQLLCKQSAILLKNDPYENKTIVNGKGSCWTKENENILLTSGAKITPEVQVELMSSTVVDYAIENELMIIFESEEEKKYRFTQEYKPEYQKYFSAGYDGDWNKLNALFPSNNEQDSNQFISCVLWGIDRGNVLHTINDVKQAVKRISNQNLVEALLRDFKRVIKDKEKERALPILDKIFSDKFPGKEINLTEEYQREIVMMHFYNPNSL